MPAVYKLMGIDLPPGMEFSVTTPDGTKVGLRTVPLPLPELRGAAEVAAQAAVVNSEWAIRRWGTGFRGRMYAMYGVTRDRPLIPRAAFQKHMHELMSSAAAKSGAQTRGFPKMKFASEKQSVTAIIAGMDEYARQKESRS